MPLYEYECLKCGKRTEVLQSFKDAPLTVCPTCGGEMKKLISSPAFHLKGTGWYATDYAGKKGGAKSDGKSESKSEGKSEGKSETSGGTESGSSSSEPAKPAAAESKPSGGSSGKTE